MKTAKDKMIGPGEASNKLPSALRCVAECVIIDAGTFERGQVVSDPAIIKKIAGSPCFSPVEEE